LRSPRQAVDLRRIEAGFGKDVDQLNSGRVLSR
jgi:hypothetical protein